MPNPKTANMQSMSKTYMAALCAVNGYTMNVDSEDYDSVDLTIKCPGIPDDSLDPNSNFSSPVLEIQLKSTYSEVRRMQNGCLSYNLKVKNYNDLVPVNRIVPRILVLFLMYEDEQYWVEHTIDFLKITKCAYWVCLQGLPLSDNSETQAISIPENQVLSPDELKRIMIIISKGETL